MRPYDVKHDDPVSLARTAAIRARSEQDPLTREAARGMTPSERLERAVAISRELARLERVG